jgi:hypothetical protein
VVDTRIKELEIAIDHANGASHFQVVNLDAALTDG